jgi:hypothetical protein
MRRPNQSLFSDRSRILIGELAYLFSLCLPSWLTGIVRIGISLLLAAGLSRFPKIAHAENISKESSLRAVSQPPRAPSSSTNNALATEDLGDQPVSSTIGPTLPAGIGSLPSGDMDAIMKQLESLQKRRQESLEFMKEIERQM